MSVTLGDGLGGGGEVRLEKALVRLNESEQNVPLVSIFMEMGTLCAYVCLQRR